MYIELENEIYETKLELIQIEVTGYCNMHCEHCRASNQPQKMITIDQMNKILSFASKVKSEDFKLTFSGGEPLMQVDALIDIVKKLEGFDIAVYTGHEFEEVPQELLDNIGYIKTGSFKEELKSTIKPYVGSTNQEFRRVK